MTPLRKLVTQAKLEVKYKHDVAVCGRHAHALGSDAERRWMCANRKIECQTFDV